MVLEILDIYSDFSEGQLNTNGLYIVGFESYSVDAFFM